VTKPVSDDTPVPVGSTTVTVPCVFPDNPPVADVVNPTI
jgi:hypothetical protein